MPDPAPTSPTDDWTTSATERIVSVVGAVRDKTTNPILFVARALVYGLLAAVAGATLLVLAVIMVMRLHVYLPFHPEARQVWVTDAALTVVFFGAGMFCWKKRGSPGR